MHRRVMVFAAALALATGCHVRKVATTADRPKSADVVAAEAEPPGDMPRESESDQADVVAEPPPEIIGTVVTARVDTVDLENKRVVFRIEESRDEILLQAGKEIFVPFMDLLLLTGMPREKAIEALEKAGAVPVRVYGEGDEMRILEIELEGT